MKNIKLVLSLFIITLLMFGCQEESDNSKMDRIYNSLNIQYEIGDDEYHVSQDITLVDSIENVNITWSSSNKDVISNTGVVTLGLESIDIELIATLKLNSITRIKTFIVTVIKDESIDVIAPILRIDSDYRIVNIIQGETVDLFLGLSVVDNVDTDLFDSIVIIDDGGLDFEIDGEYIVSFQVSDKAGNLSNIITKTIKVARRVSILNPFPIFTGVIPNEVAKPEKQKMFQGAWYHKVMSAKDDWIGIEGIITLPEVEIRRYNGPYNQSLPVDPNVKNLDNPSIYMGGHANTESDVGLTLGTVMFSNGSFSTGSYAYRPFWRYITNTDYDIGPANLAIGRRYGTSTSSPESATTKNVYGN